MESDFLTGLGADLEPIQLAQRGTRRMQRHGDQAKDGKEGNGKTKFVHSWNGES